MIVRNISDIRLCDFSSEELLRERYKWFKQIGYEPFPEQDLIHKSMARFKIAACGTRFGKSMLAAREVEPYILLPIHSIGWIVATTYQVGEKEFRYIWNDLIINQKLPTIRKNYNLRVGDMRLEFPWGAKVYVRSLKNPDDLYGEEVDWMIISEASKVRRQDWERILRGRLTSRLGKLLIPTTPKGRNWVYDLWLKGQNPEYKEYESWLYPSSCNPYLDPDDIEDAKDTLSTKFFIEQYGGQFISLTGSIYSEFSEDNICDCFPDGSEIPPENMRIYRVIDFGFQNPFVCLFIAVEDVEIPENMIAKSTSLEAKNIKGFDKTKNKKYTQRLWVFDEHYLNQTRLSEHAEMILEKSETMMNRIECTIADSEAAQEIFEMGEWLDDLIATNKVEIGIGIERVAYKIKTKINGLPLFMILRHCSHTIEELRDYEWDDSPRNERNEKEMPKKHKDHCPDTVRYIVNYLHEAEPELVEV